MTVSITVLADHVDEHALRVRGIRDQTADVVPLQHLVAVASA